MFAMIDIPSSFNTSVAKGGWSIVNVTETEQAILGQFELKKALKSGDYIISGIEIPKLESNFTAFMGKTEDGYNFKTYADLSTSDTPGE